MMKVKELIEILKKCNQEYEVAFTMDELIDPDSAYTNKPITQEDIRERDNIKTVHFYCE